MPSLYSVRSTSLFFQITSGWAPRSTCQLDQLADQRRLRQIEGLDQHELAVLQLAAMIDQDFRQARDARIVHVGRLRGSNTRFQVLCSAAVRR